MTQTGSWKGYTFEVGPDLIRSFEEMSLKGHCETETKTKGKQKYVVRKNGDVTELTFSVGISAILGVTDVRGEALNLVKSANNGDKDYFYYGTKKLVTYTLMLTSAEVTEIDPLPGNADTWISCNVKLTFKQADNAGDSSSGKKKKRKKKSAKGNGTGDGAGGGDKPVTQPHFADHTELTKLAKDASKNKIPTGGLQYYTDLAKKAQSGKNTGNAKIITTGRSARPSNKRVAVK